MCGHVTFNAHLDAVFRSRAHDAGTLLGRLREPLAGPPVLRISAPGLHHRGMPSQCFNSRQRCSKTWPSGAV